MVRYQVIEIFTSERTRWEGRPIDQAIVERVRSLKIAARCLVARGIEGCYENGEVATRRIELLSYNMPVRITIVLPASETDRVLREMDAMVSDGVVAVQELRVVAHRTRKLLLPRQVKVCDIMTREPVSVEAAAPLDRVVRVLLSARFSGMPVVDAERRPVGIVTPSDLIGKGRLPVRLGLLAAAAGERLDEILAELATRTAGEVMSAPPVTIGADRYVREAVDLMIERQLKRLPVVDERGRLTGMLSRLDVFQAITDAAPHWEALGRQQVLVGSLRTVADVMGRDPHAVSPDTPIEEVIRTIAANAVQRVAVVDRAGKLLGLIADRDLLAAFASDASGGLWEQVKGLIPFTGHGRRHRALKGVLRAKTAAEVMQTDLVTVREDVPIDAAIGLMTARGFKRLPVVDGAGVFKGMISRDALLRVGFPPPSATGPPK
jgi:CBS domain-containing protein